MTNTSTIKVDINNPAPSSYEVYSHELNYGSTKFIEVEFFSYSQPLDFTDVTITATIVCNGYLVAEDIAVTSVTENKVKMLISSTANYTILKGLMYIEFKFEESNTELYPPTPIVIDVKSSIRDDAQVTPESYGTVSEILQEVATARGNFNSLDARLDNIENDVDGILPIGETDISDGAVTNGKIYTGAVTGDKIDGRTITGDKLALESVDTTELADLSVTYDKLATDTTNYIDSHLPYAQIVQNVGGVAAPVDITYLNSLTFNKKTFYYVWFAVNALFDGSPREWCIFLQLESNYQIAIRPNGNIYYREYSNAQWGDFTKNTAEIESDISTLKYNSAQAQAAIIRLNDEVADIKATITQVNTQLENAINGVSE